MLLGTFFRRSAAIWLSPAVLFLIVYFANESPRPASTIYPLALTVTGASEVFLIAPFCAACAAWEGGRLRRAGWLRYHAPGRSSASSCFRWCRPWSSASSRSSSLFS